MNYGLDVAVLLIFFNRPKCLQKVFDEVKKARPAKLFLYQDGPRNESDRESIAECRRIVSDIEWDCTVKTLFQSDNVGCDPSEYIAQKWAFTYTDKCIILEDDDVPSQSFFIFCKELLDRYEFDERINMICGMNNLETWVSPYSYLFTETGSIWGWATWKRVIDKWDGEYGFLNDEYNTKLLKRYFDLKGVDTKNRFQTWNNNAKSGIEHYETVLGISQFVNHGLNIVPTQNMIINIGNSSEGSTHSAGSIQLIPRGLRRIYTMKTYEIEFPLKHPPFIIEDVDYQKELFRVMGTGHPFIKAMRKIERGILLLKYEGIKSLINKIKKYKKK